MASSDCNKYYNTACFEVKDDKKIYVQFDTASTPAPTPTPTDAFRVNAITEDKTTQIKGCLIYAEALTDGKHDTCRMCKSAYGLGKDFKTCESDRLHWGVWVAIALGCVALAGLIAFVVKKNAKKTKNSLLA